MKVWKVLDENGKPCHGGCGKYHLPKDDQPGKWMPKIDNVVACEHGYHSLRKSHVVRWLGPTIWEAETRGPLIRRDDKVVSGEIRLVRKLDTWNERTQRLFAWDCAQLVLHLHEKEHPNDNRPRHAIEVARLFACGAATREELDAARDAAWAAANDATWDAASDSAWDTAKDAAWDAARAAAGAAASDSARDSTWVTAKDAAWVAAWATAKDAAWVAAWATAKDAVWAAALAAAKDAARAAAWAAAEDAASDSAMAAANDAAWAAAEAAARAAARAAAWEQQTKTLWGYLYPKGSK